MEQAQREGLLSDEHFTVDGTLIEAWASLKSVRPKKPSTPAPPPDDPGNPTVDFHRERRTNTTHQTTTDPEARLARKGTGKAAKLCLSRHALMENRQGLCVIRQGAPATGTAERDTALAGSTRDPPDNGGGGQRAITAATSFGVCHGAGFGRTLRVSAADAPPTWMAGPRGTRVIA